MPGNNPLDKRDVQGTIRKSVLTGRLFEGFWERWIAHGLKREDVSVFRPQLTNSQRWTAVLQEYAQRYEQQAAVSQGDHRDREAEMNYRTAALYAQLIQWIHPDACEEKRRWYRYSRELADRADQLSADKILYVDLPLADGECIGRIRIPEKAAGCVILLHPIDSAKEEMFAYEMDFVASGFVTLSFDGPGQGETYVKHSIKASANRWQRFVDTLINYAAARFPEMKLYLFGTSSGGAWALYGMGHPKVSKAAAVSPACASGVKLPDYFLERLSYILDVNETSLLPNSYRPDRSRSVLLFHGREDVMVPDEAIHKLHQEFGPNSRLIELEGQGHCCNDKLSEIRQICSIWFMEGDDEHDLRSVLQTHN